MEFNSLVDRGERENFKTGSIRDTPIGKGLPHLMATEALLECMPDSNFDFLNAPKESIDFLLNTVYKHLSRFGNLILSVDRNEHNEFIRYSVMLTMEAIYISENCSLYKMMTRFTKHYENGAKKYAANNWRKGQPVSRYYDSAMRHLWLAMDKDTTEDHLAALLWNLTCIIQTKIDVNIHKVLPVELDDFPFIADDIFIKTK
jgi:hypothetical protein